MALQMSYTAEDGTVYPECYVQISNIIAMPDQSMICTNYFANIAAHDAGSLPLCQPAYHPATTLFDTGPIFDVAYDYLLTLPEFAGAVPVLIN
jgi:hypothetical protein